MSAQVDPRFIDTKTAAKLISMSPHTLQKWRSRGSDGPPFYPLGGNKVVYDPEEVVAWMRKRRHVPAATQLAATA
jgi:predicted DNA-binding transcriptional regulator AlpA